MPLEIGEQADVDLGHARLNDNEKTTKKELCNGGGVFKFNKRVYEGAYIGLRNFEVDAHVYAHVCVYSCTFTAVHVLRLQLYSAVLLLNLGLSSVTAVDQNVRCAAVHVPKQHYFKKRTPVRACTPESNFTRPRTKFIVRY
eukprot:SAG31_NODE_995_length_10494_cov_8.173641_3_plen_141_part_00